MRLRSKSAPSDTHSPATFRVGTKVVFIEVVGEVDLSESLPILPDARHGAFKRRSVL
jgi:hypothetical protein